jgi:DNA-binding PadR family transcriptional regulator
MRKLTEAQKRCLSDVANGSVSQEFDIWRGYRWRNGEFVSGWRKSERNMPKPLARLCDLGLAEIGSADRPCPGRHLSHYTLTPAGRAKLAEER